MRSVRRRSAELLARRSGRSAVLLLVMKCVVLACCVLWVAQVEGGALKCVPNSEDAPCLTEPQEPVPDLTSGLNEEECLAGTEWKSNCFLCRCSSEGVANCVRETLCIQGMFEQPIRCKPGSTFKRDCNTCTCLDNGLGLCTLRNCMPTTPAPPPIPKKENLPIGLDCAPDSTWKSQCNDCVCSPEGVRFCTEDVCPDSQKSEPVLRCAPHSLWKRECNTCWCTSDGLPMCTKIGCVGILSDMNFTDAEGNSEELIEITDSDQLLQAPIHEVEVDHQKNITNQKYDPVSEQNLTGVVLKDLDEINNDIETLTRITKENIDDKEVFNSERARKDLEELDTSYIDHNAQNAIHRVLKRSVCKPNQDFESDCNTCKCSATGQSYTCTQNECMDKDKEDVDKQVEVFMESEGVDHIERHSVCKPGDTFFVGCNPCHCNVDGTDFSCTNKPCPLPKDVEVFHELNVLKSGAEPNSPVKIVCEKNSRFKSDCNTCWCNNRGTSASCTRRGCPKTTEKPVAEDDKTEVLKSGAEPTSPVKICEENSRFKMDCNTCLCSKDGTSAACTRKRCIQKDIEKPVAEEVKPEVKKSAPKPSGTKKVCVENRMFILNCNTCWCNEDGTSYFCTRKVCVNELPGEPVVEEGKPENLRVIKRDCRPDEVFELDCNMCRCNADGKSFSCTRRACVDEDAIAKNETQLRKTRAAPQEPPPKTCQPGQEFRMDCNKCLCDSEGQDFSCTRIDCNAQNNNNNGGTRRRREVSKNVPTNCVPGSVFDRDCNVCRCTDDGTHATCTLKRCKPHKENSTSSATESSFRCNPGEQFKQSCNDCSCSADGRSVFCTLMICDGDLTP